MSIPVDIEAEIYFLTAEEGGRSTPAYDDYRPQFCYSGRDWVVSLSYPDVESANPGETVRTYIGFMSPKEHLGKVFEDMEFVIREGAREVGRGTVTKLIDLEQSAGQAD